MTKSKKNKNNFNFLNSNKIESYQSVPSWAQQAASEMSNNRILASGKASSNNKMSKKKNMDTYSPDYIIKNFLKKELFKNVNDKKYKSMLKDGRKSQTYLQKRFAAQYFDYLLNTSLEYIKKMKKEQKLPKNCLLKIIDILENNNILKQKKYLEKRIELNEKSKKLLIDNFDIILSHFSECKKLDNNNKQLMAISKSIMNSFYQTELGLPQYHFYTGLIGYSFAFGKQKKINISIDKLLLVHSLANALEKTIKRSKNVKILMEQAINDYGEDLSRLSLNFLIKKYIKDYNNSPLYSTSPMQSISLPKENGEYDKNYKVLIEGNGRLGALKYGFMNIKKKYKNFKTPKIQVLNSEIKETIGIKNQYYLINLLWSNIFPNVKIKGYNHQLKSKRLYEYGASNESHLIVKKYPIFFGYLK